MKRTILILALVVAGNCFSQNPVNKNAAKEAKQLLGYIYSLEEKILSGQHSYNEVPDNYYNKAEEISKNYPAVWGTDFY